MTMEFWGHGGGSAFWNFRRQAGVKTWKPSVVGYGYFLELPNVEQNIDVCARNNNIVLLHQKRKRENSLFWGLKWTTIKLYNLPTYFCLWLQFKWILLPYTGLNSPNPPYPRVAVFQKLLRSLAQSRKNKTYVIFLSGNSQFPKFRLKSSSNWSVSRKIIPYSRPKLSDLYTLSRSIIAWKPYPSQRHISIWPIILYGPYMAVPHLA